MVRDRPVRFTWGPVLLASLYMDLHEYVYVDGRALGAEVTLLHVWAWKHISMLRPCVVLVPMGAEDALVARYRGGVSFTQTGKHGIPYWRQVLDEMFVFLGDCTLVNLDGPTMLPSSFITARIDICRGVSTR